MMTDGFHATPARHLRFWALAFAAFLGFVWLLGDILTPFVLGFAIAYFLDPTVHRFMRLGFSRTGATLLVLLLFLVAVTSLILLLTPIISHQVANLVTALPDYIDRVRDYLRPLMREVFGRLSEQDYQNMRTAAGENAAKMMTMAGAAFTGLLAGGKAVLGAISFFVIMPVVAFYIMRDWPGICQKLDSLLPRRAVPTIREELKKIDDVLSGFVRGQTMVCFTLAMYHAAALTLAGLNFGFVIGLLIGFFSFVPYVGTALGFLVCTAVGLAQFGFELPLFIVWGILVFGQLMEGYVLVPRMVGQSVGLHDLWVIFSIMAGGLLMGFLGVLLAVPVAAVIGVGLRYGLSRYKKSRYYLGGASSKRRLRPL